MPNSVSVPELAALAAQLPPEQRRQLAEQILRDLAGTEASPRVPRFGFWREIRGMVPCPMFGEDAQAWVSRSRREADAGRRPSAGTAR